MEHFLDTNIILGYAIDFEKDHNKCIIYLQNNDVKRTGTMVNSEISKIRKRRQKLYSDLSKHVRSQKPPSQYVASVSLSNDIRHMTNFIGSINSSNIGQILNYITRKGKEIEKGIQEALTKIKRPLISPANDTILEACLNSCVYNRNDVKIISDALCYAEKNSKMIFCSNDYTDIIKNRNKIYKEITNNRSYPPQNIPIEIKSLSEIIP